MNVLLLAVLSVAMPGINFSGWVLAAPTGGESKLLPNADNSTGGVLPETVEVRDVTEVSEQDAMSMLEGLGYGDSGDGLSIGTRFFDSDEISNLYRSFQSDFALPQTGVLDEETKVAITSPKCGLKKSDKMVGDVRVWNKNRLTYRISNYPNVKRTDIIRELIKKSFDEWSKVTNLDFVEVNRTSVDIEVSFGGRHHRLRGEECLFDKPATLAHAYFPEIGDLHFNTNYFFDTGKSLADFFDTALHEIGHSLGLEHINSTASLMHPSASNQFTKPQPIDVQKIQSLYGARKTASTATGQSAPKLCSLKKMDAALVDSDGRTYVFAGDYYYDVTSSQPVAGLISSKWPGLPGNIDAAFRWTNDKTYFFKRDKFWRFKSNRLEAGYPRSISKGFPGIPSSVDGLMVDSDGDIFAFKGSKYSVYYAEAQQISREANINVLGASMPKSVDAALNMQNELMVFKGTNFYEFKNGGVKEYRNSWFIC